MKEPKVVEKFDHNGEHSHWELVNSETGAVIWLELSPEDETIIIEGRRFRRGDICDIFEIERDRTMFLNRNAGFIVKLYGDKDHGCKTVSIGEAIPYETTSYGIADKKSEWDKRMKKAISLWKNN